MEIQLHSFLTSVLDGGRWLTLSSSRFIFARKFSSHWIGEQIGPEVGVVALEKKNVDHTGTRTPDCPARIIATVTQVAQNSFQISTRPFDSEVQSNL
jgi:hypothetical protein